MRKTKIKKSLWLGCLLLFLSTGLGCAKQAQPELVALARDLSLDKVNIINGTYGPLCKNRLGAWSLANDDLCGSLPNPELSVETGDQACVLTVTSVEIDCVLYTTRGISLQGTYQPYGFPFVKQGECNPSFYANANVSDSSYLSDFLIKFIFSTSADDTSASAIAKFDTPTAYIFDIQIPAPDYTLNTIGLHIQVDITNKVIQTGGVIQLQPGIHLGEAYAVLPGPLGDGQRNFHDVNALFETLPQQPIGVPIDASSLQLMNVTLTAHPEVQRSIIIVHREHDVPSYELITLTISKP